jgi:LAO/AO transport system kinase
VSRYRPSLDLVARVEAGEPAAVARMISRAESGTEEAREALAAIYRRAGQSHVIGITGVPGSGKSTLVGRLAAQLRENGTKVGIIAIDPSSPYSGGAILGDRIRMSELTSDPGIYIRSMATHGATGGMARAALDAVDILDVAGFSTIIIETVGVGQDEVEIAKASDTTVVVSAPGLGDEIQAIQGGHIGDRRHPCRLEVRPAGRQPHPGRFEADADARRDHQRQGGVVHSRGRNQLDKRPRL